MKHLLCYLLAAFVLTLVETLLPAVPFARPDLLLLLVISLGLREKVLPGGPLAYLIGCLRDSLSGSCLGLFGLIYLLLFLALRSIAGILNAESPLLTLFLVAVGTLFQALLLIFTLGLFSDTGTYWNLILGNVPWQLPVNLLTALVLLQAAAWARSQRRRLFGFSHIRK
jgi:rod shape-determining protein MreD